LLETEPEPAPADDPHTVTARRPVLRRGDVVVVGAIALIFVLLAFTVVVESDTQWYPQGDLALTELRVRDVASTHPPLVGLVGRIGSPTERGSHLGPVSFYSMFPAYRLFGANSWALIVATAMLNWIAAAISLWIASRRGGTALVLTVSVLIVTLLIFLGPATVTRPWNPYLPVMWWLVFLFAAWSVLCDDIVLLPVAAFAATFCVQTHVSYVAVVTACTLLVVGHLVLSWRRAEGDERSRLTRWSAWTALFGAVLWLPPIYQQLRGKNGNLAVVIEHFANPPETPIGLAEGLQLMLVHMNPLTLYDGSLLTTEGSTLPGVIVLIAWVASAAVAWRLRERVLTRLNALIGVALVAGTFSMGRIFGQVWSYLLIWSWVLCGVVAISIGWAVAAALRHALSPERMMTRVTRRAAPIVAIVLIVVLGSQYLRDARNVELAWSDHQNRIAEQLVEPTMKALREGNVPGGGTRGTYFLPGFDDLLFGPYAFTLMNELERAGFKVGGPGALRAYYDTSRIRGIRNDTGIIWLALGDAWIKHWEERPEVVKVAQFDDRTAFERARYYELLDRARARLLSLGLTEQAEQLETNAWAVASDRRVPDDVRMTISAMVYIGVPAAVFVGPGPRAQPKPNGG
jgi:hypothetical protein